MNFPYQKHLDHITDDLWHRDLRATVMVGSGFSRYALKTQSYSGDLPTSQELTNELYRKLYNQDPNLDNRPGGFMAGGFPRMAQEYAASFGRNELHRFLQNQIMDDDLNPGDVHQRLLRLPWRDVFTTNWDTLLEKQSESVAEQKYSIVRNKDEIPLTVGPRIVKLHGSFPAYFPLICTEEDYRRYPVQFAPFVNMVQQAMMETTFFLIGFSGDDPNFLHWSGWVRDNLGELAPKIYLAGWLNLQTSSKTYTRRAQYYSS